MGIRPEIRTILGVEVRLYNFSTYATLWRKETRLGYLTPSPAGGDLWQTDKGFAGTFDACLEDLVRARKVAS